MEVWSSFLESNTDCNALTSFSVCIWIIWVTNWCQSFSPLSESPVPAGCGPRRGEWGSSRAGMDTHCICAHPVPCESLVQDSGTKTWGTDRCWIPAQLLIVVVQPWFPGVLGSHLLCWTSPSSSSQSLAPSCTCWCLHSRPKFRKNFHPSCQWLQIYFQRLLLRKAPRKTIYFRANGDQAVFFCFPAALLCRGLYLILCDMCPSLFTANERDTLLWIQLWYLNLQTGGSGTTLCFLSLSPLSPAANHSYVFIGKCSYGNPLSGAVCKMLAALSM